MTQTQKKLYSLILNSSLSADEKDNFFDATQQLPEAVQDMLLHQLLNDKADMRGIWQAVQQRKTLPKLKDDAAIQTTIEQEIAFLNE